MSEHPADVALQDLLSLDLEYRLTVAMLVNPHRDPCDCAKYLIGRREVLIPAVLKHAAKNGTDPVDDFAAFARRLHARHAARPAEPSTPGSEEGS